MLRLAQKPNQRTDASTGSTGVDMDVVESADAGSQSMDGGRPMTRTDASVASDAGMETSDAHVARLDMMPAPEDMGADKPDMGVFMGDGGNRAPDMLPPMPADAAAPSCDDLRQNGSETDVDCGGDCRPCSRGSMCRVADDCQSGVCSEGRCAEPTCDDGVQNGEESDVDCGPGCPPSSRRNV